MIRCNLWSPIIARIEMGNVNIYGLVFASTLLIGQLACNRESPPSFPNENPTKPMGKVANRAEAELHFGSSVVNSTSTLEKEIVGTWTNTDVPYHTEFHGWLKVVFKSDHTCDVYQALPVSNDWSKPRQLKWSAKTDKYADVGTRYYYAKVPGFPLWILTSGQWIELPAQSGVHFIYQDGGLVLGDWITLGERKFSLKRGDLFPFSK